MRSRLIRPGFFNNEELAECAFETRLFFEGLWCVADREGRLEYRPKRLKMNIFPYDNVDIPKMTAELIARRFIVKYEVGDKVFIAIPNFRKHQTIHHREAESNIPDPEQASAEPRLIRGDSEARSSWHLAEVEVEVEVKGECEGERAAPVPVLRFVELAPRITLTHESHAGLIEAFGAEAVAYYAPVCSDYLLANGKTKKDPAAFLRNWIRKDQAEQKGFYATGSSGYLDRQEKKQLREKRAVEVKNAILDDFEKRRAAGNRPRLSAPATIGNVISRVLEVKK